MPADRGFLDVNDGAFLNRVFGEDSNLLRFANLVGVAHWCRVFALCIGAIEHILIDFVKESGGSTIEILILKWIGSIHWDYTCAVLMKKEFLLLLSLVAVDLGGLFAHGMAELWYSYIAVWHSQSRVQDLLVVIVVMPRVEPSKA